MYKERTAKSTLDIEQQIRNKKTGWAVVKPYGSGEPLRIGWGLNGKMFKDRVILMKIGKEEVYVNADDMLAVLRNV